MKMLASVVLLVSLVFNVAFVVGYLVSRSTPETLATAEKVTEVVADDLALDPAQREKFAALYKKSQDDGAKLQEAIRMTRESLTAELSSPSPDPERVRTLQGELPELYRAYREASLKHYKEFMETLTPEQRRQAAERIEQQEKHHWRRPHHPPWMQGKPLERFDADGDGQLNEEERAKARESVLKEFGGRGPWGGREFGPGPFAPMPESVPLFKTMRGLRKVMPDLDEDQKAKVHDAMKPISDALAAFEGDLAGILTEEQMKRFQTEKEAGPPPGMGDPMGPRPRWHPPMPGEPRPPDRE
ncbi:MAG: Spy/CpxP family protein refolding chaperone [Planctomycetota bacterium]